MTDLKKNSILNDSSPPNCLLMNYLREDDYNSLLSKITKVKDEMYKEYEVIILGTQLKKLLEKKSEVLMQKYDLRKVELDILAYLYSYKEMYGDTAKDIVNRKHISKAHISKSVENLKERGLINLIEDKEDHRISHITLSEAANEVVREFLEIHNACKSIVFQNITEEEKRQTENIFLKMQNNINQELEKL